MISDSIIGSVLFCDAWPEHFGRLDLSSGTLFGLLIGNFNLDTLEDEPTRSMTLSKEMQFYCFLGFANVLTFHLAYNLITRSFNSYKKESSSQSSLDIFHCQEIAASMQPWLSSTDVRNFESWSHATEIVSFSIPHL